MNLGPDIIQELPSENLLVVDGENEDIRKRSDAEKSVHDLISMVQDDGYSLSEEELL